YRVHLPICSAAPNRQPTTGSKNFWGAQKCDPHVTGDVPGPSRAYEKLGMTLLGLLAAIRVTFFSITSSSPSTAPTQFDKPGGAPDWRFSLGDQSQGTCTECTSR